MIVALAYSMLCGLTIGLLKKPVAKSLHDKSLNAEATMNRDEWMSEGAAILGILLVALGFWWGDAAAAAFIALEIVHDGWMNVRLVVGDLMDEAPTIMGTHDLEDIGEKVRQRVEEMDWVAKAGVRLREHGRRLTGEVFVQPREHSDLVICLEQTSKAAGDVDWRLHDIAVMAVSDLAQPAPPDAKY
jgi:divalent metal cation (Fe/Co/Zn/Cd) transporter